MRVCAKWRERWLAPTTVNVLGIGVERVPRPGGTPVGHVDSAPFGRNTMRRFGWIGLVLAAVLVLGACSDDSGGGDGDNETLRDELIAELTADGTLNEEDAECIADGVFDELDSDTIQAFAAEDGEPPEGFEDTMIEITLECVDLEDLQISD